MPLAQISVNVASAQECTTAPPPSCLSSYDTQAYNGKTYVGRCRVELMQLPLPPPPHSPLLALSSRRMTPVMRVTPQPSAALRDVSLPPQDDDVAGGLGSGGTLAPVVLELQPHDTHVRLSPKNAQFVLVYSSGGVDQAEEGHSGYAWSFMCRSQGVASEMLANLGLLLVPDRYGFTAPFVRVLAPGGENRDTDCPQAAGQRTTFVQCWRTRFRRRYELDAATLSRFEVECGSSEGNANGNSLPCTINSGAASSSVPPPLAQHLLDENIGAGMMKLVVVADGDFLLVALLSGKERSSGGNVEGKSNARPVLRAPTHQPRVTDAPVTGCSFVPTLSKEPRAGRGASDTPWLASRGVPPPASGSVPREDGKGAAYTEALEAALYYARKATETQEAMDRQAAAYRTRLAELQQQNDELICALHDVQQENRSWRSAPPDDRSGAASENTASITAAVVRHVNVHMTSFHEKARQRERCGGGTWGDQDWLLELRRCLGLLNAPLTLSVDDAASPSRRAQGPGAGDEGDAKELVPTHDAGAQTTAGAARTLSLIDSSPRVLAPRSAVINTDAAVTSAKRTYEQSVSQVSRGGNCCGVDCDDDDDGASCRSPTPRRSLFTGSTAGGSPLLATRCAGSGSAGCSPPRARSGTTTTTTRRPADAWAVASAYLQRKAEAATRLSLPAPDCSDSSQWRSLRGSVTPIQRRATSTGAREESVPTDPGIESAVDFDFLRHFTTQQRRRGSGSR